MSKVSKRTWKRLFDWMWRRKA